MVSYFLDTYVLVKWAEGQDQHKKYLNQADRVVTSLFHLYEFHHYLLKRYGKEEAKKGFYYFERYTEKIYFEDIFLASKIKWQYHKKKLSYADCLGYTMALNRKIRFLTGDPQFEHLENVEYVP